jgi:hypothetical protein
MVRKAARISYRRRMVKIAQVNGCECGGVLPAFSYGRLRKMQKRPDSARK